MAGLQAVSVVIPAYNNRSLLERNLPPLAEELRSTDLEHEILVVDDASSDDTAGFLRERFPAVRVVRRERNGGFSRAANDGVRSARHDLVLLLNSDIRARPGFLLPMLTHFRDPAVFSVTNRCIDESGQRLTKEHTLVYRYGTFRMAYREDSERHTLSFGASGGHSLFDRRKFLELGGFDELFSPFYWEDFDLGYRAWKRGHTLIFEPASTVVHAHGSTIGALDQRYVRFVFHRNYFLVLWKNITDRRFIAEHLFFLPVILAVKTLRDPLVVASFCAALAKLPAVGRARADVRRSAVRSDREIFRLLE